MSESGKDADLIVVSGTARAEGDGERGMGSVGCAGGSSFEPSISCDS